MALDWRNDNTIRYLLQGNVTKVMRLLENEVGGEIPKRSEIDAIIADARELRDRVLEEGDVVADMTRYVLDLNASLDAILSGIGEVVQKWSTRYEVDATGVSGFFKLLEKIESLQADGLDYLSTLEGQITLGIITIPGEGGTPGEEDIGIAIGSRKITTAETYTDELGRVFHKLDTRESFAFYTATGWQFWGGGKKLGWYNSVDGMLHVGDLQIEESAQFGQEATGKWIMETEGGFGIRYLGGN